MQPEYDVFFSYSRSDSEAVTRLAEVLTGKGIKVWLDQWEIPPGQQWMDGLEEGLRKSKTTAVFIGPQGLGDWEKQEIRLAIDRQVKTGQPVIPVFLPDCPSKTEAGMALLNTYNWIDFRQRRLDDEQTIFRLRWGITGQKPTASDAPAPPPKPAPPPDADDVENAVDDLARFLRAGNVTFYLGPWSLPGKPQDTPRACEITRHLLTELKVIEPEYKELLPPLDVAGMYYNVRWRDAGLEDEVIKFIKGRASCAPPTHTRLAQLLRVLAERPASRVRRRGQQLIVTTNFDVLMERALLAAGIPFTRIVQHRSGQSITINEYRDVRLGSNGRTVLLPQQQGGAPQPVEPDDYKALDAFILDYGQRVVEQSNEAGPGVKNPLDELPVEEMTEPILYKLIGSADVPNSCAISIDHFFTFARRALRRNCIPAKITEIVGNSPALFLGYSFLDPDFRITYYALLRKPFELDMDLRYAVQLPPQNDNFCADPYRRIESGLWNYIKKFELKRSKITTVEGEGAAFLEQLLERVRKELA